MGIRLDSDEEITFNHTSYDKSDIKFYNKKTGEMVKHKEYKKKHIVDKEFYERFLINESLDPSPSGLTARELYDICIILVNDGGGVDACVAQVVNNNQFNCFWDIELYRGKMNVGDYNMDCDDILRKLSKKSGKTGLAFIDNNHMFKGLRLYIGQYRELEFEVDEFDIEAIEEVLISGVYRNAYDTHLLKSIVYRNRNGKISLNPGQYTVLVASLKYVGSDVVVSKLQNPIFTK